MGFPTTRIMGKYSISISEGNSKLGAIPSISLYPIRDCANCELCAADCYTNKIIRLYPEARKAYDRNSIVANSHRGDYFDLLSMYLDRGHPRFFRFHIAGDILDQEYFSSIEDIANTYGHTRFLVFTKRYDLDIKCTDNLSVVISRWPGDNIPKSAKGLPMAWMQDGTEHRIPRKALECPGNCENCGMCFELQHIGRSVFFLKH
jgi:ferredoxin